MERAGRLIGKLKIAKTVLDPEQLVRTAWPVAVGKRIAARTRVARLEGAALVVECEDLLWQRNVAIMQAHILKNLHDLLGPAAVTSLALRPMTLRRQPAVEGLRPAQFTLRPPGVPIDAADEASRIEDPVFRLLYMQSRKKASA